MIQIINEDILYGVVTDDATNVYFRVDYSPPYSVKAK